jgi:catechol 2,3-dioxygenase-like lactoylglutathione lyase family enzyme
MRIRAMDHIVLNVADVERSLAWYTGLLDLAPERVAEWRSGDAPFPSVRISESCIIDLFAVDRTGENLNHLCLAGDRADVEAIAGDDRFDVVDGPGRRWGARGEGWSVYVLDPDGNTVEIRAYD